MVVWKYSVDEKNPRVAKMKGFAGTEDSLKEWFLKDVPAFGYLSPMQILQIENGDDILRSFMYDSPI